MNSYRRDSVINIAFGLALAIIITIGLLYYLNMKAAREFDRMVQSSNQLILKQEEILAAMNEVEVGELAYLVTGDDRSLQPYQAALGKIERNLVELKNLAPGHPSQPSRTNRIEELIRAKLAGTVKTIDIRRREGYQAAYRFEFSEGHESPMDLIRKEIGEARASVDRHLLQRKALKEAKTRETVFAFVAGTGVSFALLLIIFFHLKHDLAERRRAETLLRLSEGRYRALYRDNPTMIATVDTELTMLSVNPACASQLGYSIQELEGESVLKLFHPDDQSGVAKELRRCLANPTEVFRWQYRKVRKDGTVLWVEETSQAVKDLQDRPNVLVVCQDVTERLTASRERERSLLQLKAVLESINETVVIVDLDCNVVTMNKEGLSLYGFESAEQAQRPLSEYQELFEIHDVEGRLLPLEEWPLCRALEGEKLVSYEIRVRRKDTGKRWIGSVNGTPVLNEKGETILAVVTERDITKRKRTEEDLRIATEQLQMITDLMPVGVVRCSRDRRYLWVSKEYARWLGWQQEEIPGRSIEEVIGREAYQTLIPHIERVLSGERVEYEARLLYGGLGMRWITGRYMPTRNDEGVPDGWVGVVLDITGRKLMETELKEAKELLEQRVEQRTAELSAALRRLQAETQQRVQAVEELRDKERILIHQSRLAAMGEMIGNIAHQWRQPLNILGLLVQDLAMTFRKGEVAPEYLESNVKKSLETIRHMSKTIDDFMYFFRPRKEKEPFRVLDVVEKTMALLEESLRAKQIATEVSAAGDPTVEGFPNEFSQVLLNIILNARDALESGAVADPTIRIGIASEGGKCVVSIRDNGGGIPEQIIGHIFDPYFTTKGPDKGTGVGLYMSKVIIENNMGGRLSARNVGGGAEFRIEL